MKLEDLFQGAVDQGRVSDGANETLKDPDLNQKITSALGVAAEDVDSISPLVVVIVVDNSISIGSNAKEVRIGHNLIKTSLKESKSGEAVLMACINLNGDTVYQFTEIENVPDFDGRNYVANRGDTPLYDVSHHGLVLLAAKLEEFRQLGSTARGLLIVITDGFDNASSKKAKDSLQWVNTLNMGEAAFFSMGIANPGDEAQFRKVFKSMGFRPDNILTPGNTASEIRKGFNVLSKSSAAVSLSKAGSVSQVSASQFGQ